MSAIINSGRSFTSVRALSVNKIIPSEAPSRALYKMNFETLQRLKDEYLIGYILNRMDPLIDHRILTEARDAGYHVEIPTSEMIELIEIGRALRVAILALKKNMMRSFESAIRKYNSGGKYVFFQYMWNEKPLTANDVIELAIEWNKLEAIKFIMNMLNFDVNSLLRLAVKSNREEITRFLVSRGGDDYEGAIIGTNNKNMIEYLLEQDVEYNGEVLYHLIELGDSKLVDRYLKDGQDFDKNYIHTASTTGSIEMIKVLISKTSIVIDDRLVTDCIFNVIVRRMPTEEQYELIDYLLTLGEFQMNHVELALCGVERNLLDRVGGYEGDLEQDMIDFIESAEYDDTELDEALTMIMTNDYDRVRDYLIGRMRDFGFSLAKAIKANRLDILKKIMNKGVDVDYAMHIAKGNDEIMEYLKSLKG